MLEKFLFKPCLIRNDETGNERFIVIFNMDETKSTNIQHDGTQAVTNTITLSFVDILNTILAGKTIIEDVVVKESDLDSFHEVDIKRNLYQINLFAETVTQEITKKEAELSELTSILNCLFSSQEMPQDAILSLNLKNIFDNSPLNQEESKKILPKIAEVVQSNMDINIESEEDVDTLIRQIEVAIIDVLPSSIQIEDININREMLVKQIKLAQQNNEESDLDDLD